ncbi:MAG: hypothetical protein ACE5Q6_13960, partial [Dehalococcoidia bacterium]
IVGHYMPGVNISRVANLIIGKPEDDFAFMGDIITGPFDADKLDYLVRDCYFCGIRSDVDVPRIALSVAHIERPRFPIAAYPKRYLVMRRTGASNLEQIIMSKMILFSAIYHHHKIRALECMVRSIFETIWENPTESARVGLPFNNVRSFLDTSEYDFFSRASQSDLLSSGVKGILNRDLLKRVLVIADGYIETSTGDQGSHNLFKINSEDHLDTIRDLRQLIYENIPNQHRTQPKDLWLDLPKSPGLGKDADRCYIDDGTATLRSLAEYFPYPRWVEAYEERKWRGHVFYAPDLAGRRAANAAAKEVMEDFYSVRFTSQATTEALKN